MRILLIVSFILLGSFAVATPVNPQELDVDVDRDTINLALFKRQAWISSQSDHTYVFSTPVAEDVAENYGALRGLLFQGKGEDRELLCMASAVRLNSLILPASCFYDDNNQLRTNLYYLPNAVTEHDLRRDFMPIVSVRHSPLFLQNGQQDSNWDIARATLAEDHPRLISYTQARSSVPRVPSVQNQSMSVFWFQYDPDYRGGSYRLHRRTCPTLHLRENFFATECDAGYAYWLMDVFAAWVGEDDDGDKTDHVLPGGVVYQSHTDMFGFNKFQGSEYLNQYPIFNLFTFEQAQAFTRSANIHRMREEQGDEAWIEHRF